MAWEARNGRGRYYTRSMRRGGRVIRRYVGSGLLGTLAAENDALRREARQADLNHRRELRQAEAMLDEFCRLTTAAARVAIEAAGYHNHKGQWRKRRGKQMERS